MSRNPISTLLIMLLLAAVPGDAQTQSASRLEAAAAQRLEAIREHPQLLVPFLRQLPKGGDLHNHLSGAVYAESFLQYAADDGLCIDALALAFAPAPCDAAHGRPPASQAFADPVLYRQMIDSFSMRHFVPGPQSGHDHFFDTFGKFRLVSRPAHLAEMLAEVRARAAAENVLYLELILDPTGGAAARFAAGAPAPEANLEAARARVLAAGLNEVVNNARVNLDQAETKSQSLLHCDAPAPGQGCAVVVRYVAEVHRGLSPAQVFAEMITGFELAGKDSRLAGVNLVMPEDAYVEMHDFDLHMKMMDHLHGVYPRVHISLHAGELAPGLTPPEGLRDHIRKSIALGHAERIGHGVDVMYEDEARGLLRTMAQRHILVEICLTSNDVILGVRGGDHPLPAYLRYGVPVAIATDDAGVSRSDMTQEYLRAVETYGLGYRELKNMIRDSIEYSFLSGASLWMGSDRTGPNRRMNSACAGQGAAAIPSGPCKYFLSQSDRATVQWKLEQELRKFEGAASAVD